MLDVLDQAEQARQEMYARLREVLAASDPAVVPPCARSTRKEASM